MGALRILVVDDHDLVRAGVAAAAGQLSAEAEIFSAASIAQALEIFKKCPEVDLVLLDLVLPDATGFSGLEAILACSPDVPVILLTADVRKETMEQAFIRGASGYIPKSSNMAIIVNALRIILAGGRYLPGELLGLKTNAEAPLSTEIPVEPDSRKQEIVAGVVAPSDDDEGAYSGRDMREGASFYGLTSRQRAVAKLLSEGMSNKEICRELTLSVSTVKTHVASILRALRTSSRAKAMAILAEAVRDLSDE